MNERHPALTKSIATIARRYPFYGSLLLQLPWVVDNKLKGFATDGSAYYYNDQVIDDNLTELTALCMRLSSHVALMHAQRMQTRDPKVWNKAITEISNRDLRESGLNIPDSFDLPPDEYRKPERSSEQYYEHLLKNDKKQQKQQSSGGGMMPSPGENGDDGDDGNNDNPLGKHAQNITGKTGVVSPDANPDAGDEQDENNPSSVRKLSNSEAQSMIRASAMAAQNMGCLPAEIKRMIEELDAPKRDWRTELLHLLSDKRPGPKNYNRVNRRFITQGIYLPTRVKEVAGSLVLGIDTSGSIDTVMLSKFAAHIKTLISQIPFNKIVVIFCDAEVAGVHEYEPDQFDTINLKNAAGGGGTAFEPVIQYAQQMVRKGDAVDALVYFTDGYGSYGAQPDEFPVVWAMTTDYGAPWGTQIYVDCD